MYLRSDRRRASSSHTGVTVLLVFAFCLLSPWTGYVVLDAGHFAMQYAEYSMEEATRPAENVFASVGATAGIVMRQQMVEERITTTAGLWLLFGIACVLNLLLTNSNRHNTRFERLLNLTISNHQHLEEINASTLSQFELARNHKRIRV